MTFTTQRLVLRAWRESDAESLYEYAKDPLIGPIAGWKPHTSVSDSLNIIRTVLSGDETYAVTLAGSDKAIGSIGLMIGDDSKLTTSIFEAEIGYWIGVPFWGKGYIPEAVRILTDYAFSTLGLERLWCGYFDGNDKSRRVQEKCGFVYHHTLSEVYVEQLDEKKVEHITTLSKQRWLTAKRGINLRLEQPSDYKIVERLTYDAFETMVLPERTHTSEHFLAHILRESDAFVKELDFVAEIDGEIVGNIMYTKSKVVRPDGNELETLTFGPLSVQPQLHKSGVGTALVLHTLALAGELGYKAVLITGHPEYYARFGFIPASRLGITTADGGTFDAFMALELEKGYLGNSGGKWYYCDEYERCESDTAAFAAYSAEFLGM